MKKISIREVDDKVDYKNLWEKLVETLHLEVKLCNSCIKKAVKTKSYDEAHKIFENLATVEWVLAEMDNLEITGEVM